MILLKAFHDPCARTMSSGAGIRCVHARSVFESNGIAERLFLPKNWATRRARVNTPV